MTASGPGQAVALAFVVTPGCLGVLGSAGSSLKSSLGFAELYCYRLQGTQTTAHLYSWSNSQAYLVAAIHFYCEFELAAITGRPLATRRSSTAREGVQS